MEQPCVSVPAPDFLKAHQLIVDLGVENLALRRQLQEAVALISQLQEPEDAEEAEDEEA